MKFLLKTSLKYYCKEIFRKLCKIIRCQFLIALADLRRLPKQPENSLSMQHNRHDFSSKTEN